MCDVQKRLLCRSPLPAQLTWLMRKARAVVLDVSRSVTSLDYTTASHNGFSTCFLEARMSHQSSPVKKLRHGGCWLCLGQEAPGDAGSRVARDRWAQPSGDWAPRSSPFDVAWAWINPFEARSPTLMIIAGCCGLLRVIAGYWVITFSCLFTVTFTCFCCFSYSFSPQYP